MNTVIKISRELHKSTGKNLFKLSDLNKSEETWVVPSKKLTLDLKPNTAYTCSSNTPFTSTANIYFNGVDTPNAGVYLGKNVTAISDIYGKLYIAVPNNREYTNQILRGEYYIQIEEGTEATPYEPYVKTKYLPRHLLNRRSVIF